MTLLKMELKANLKSLIIWTICVAGMCLACILVYSSMEESISKMGDSFTDMGSFATAFGMDRVSIITMEGYFAVEIALMHGLGGAMFAAIMGSSLLAKEEGGHTAEFLLTLPVKRKSVVLIKYLIMVIDIVLFNLISWLLYTLGIAALNEDVSTKKLVLYLVAVIIMQIELGSICFLISAFQKRSQVGLGLGISVLMFSIDMMCRIVPALKNLKYITPFYFANAADIFTTEKLYGPSTMVGICVLLVTTIWGCVHYMRKDIAS